MQYVVFWACPLPRIMLLGFLHVIECIRSLSLFIALVLTLYGYNKISLAIHQFRDFGVVYKFGLLQSCCKPLRTGFSFRSQSQVIWKIKG